MLSPRYLAAAGIILTAYLGLGLTNARTKAPWCDEAWFGNPAYNLAWHGFMGTTVLDPASSTWKSVRLTGIDLHTYWVMPVNLLFNAAAFRVFGFNILPMRLLSLAWGLIALSAWVAIVWKLTGQTALALAAAGAIAIDYHFLMQAADGRMDVMAIALGYSAVAAYLLLRDQRLSLAVAVSHGLAALALFTHPNAVVLVLILVCTMYYFDWQRVRPSTLLLAVAPYLVLGAGWALYILQNPADFTAQFLGNASGRGPTLRTPVAALLSEISTRYLTNFGIAGWSSLTGRLNVIPLLMFLAGVAVCLATPAIRRHAGYRLLLIWLAIVAIFLAELEGLKTPFYLIYITPIYSALMVAAAARLWSQFSKWRIPIAGALAVFCLLQGGRTLITDARHPRKSTYDPAVQFMRARFTPRTFIMGGAEFLFGLGPDWNLLDDVRLGYNTGKKPDVVIIDPAWEDRIQMLETVSPPIHAFVTHLLATEFHEVYNHEGYRILARNTAPPGQPRLSDSHP